MTIQESLRSASLTLQQAGCDAPRLDAELLLTKILERNRPWLIAHANENMSTTVQKAYAPLVERRRQREPLAYIMGEREFWSRSFLVTPDVLIPRPETEHLIEAVMEYFPETKKVFHFCDMGTGSGCIAVTLACEYPKMQMTATDISHAALAIARKNAERHDVSSRIKWYQGDMFAALKKRKYPFDAIISNPPYIGQNEMHALEAELGFEPRHALTDESTGLVHLQSLVDQAPSWLTKGGILVVETGLCGLPSSSPSMCLKNTIHDLAGQLRGGVYVVKER